MNENKLILNETKTKTLLFGTRYNLGKIPTLLSISMVKKLNRFQTSNAWV
jgi:hypothetical protein